MQLLLRYNIWHALNMDSMGSSALKWALTIQKVLMVLEEPAFSEWQDYMVLLAFLSRWERLEFDGNEIHSLDKPHFFALGALLEIIFVLDWATRVRLWFHSRVSHYKHLTWNDALHLIRDISQMCCAETHMHGYGSEWRTFFITVCTRSVNHRSAHHVYHTWAIWSMQAFKQSK